MAAGPSAPAHQREMALAVHQAHDRDRLRGGDIVAWREIGLLLIAKQRPQGFRRCDDCVAAAHSPNPYFAPA